MCGKDNLPWPNNHQQSLRCYAHQHPCKQRGPSFWGIGASPTAMQLRMEGSQKDDKEACAGPTQTVVGTPDKQNSGCLSLVQLGQRSLLKRFRVPASSPISWLCFSNEMRC